MTQSERTLAAQDVAPLVPGASTAREKSTCGPDSSREGDAAGQPSVRAAQSAENPPRSARCSRTAHLKDQRTRQNGLPAREVGRPGPRDGERGGGGLEGDGSRHTEGLGGEEKDDARHCPPLVPLCARTTRARRRQRDSDSGLRELARPARPAGAACSLTAIVVRVERPLAARGEERACCCERACCASESDLCAACCVGACGAELDTDEFLARARKGQQLEDHGDPRQRAGSSSGGPGVEVLSERAVQQGPLGTACSLRSPTGVTSPVTAKSKQDHAKSPVKRSHAVPASSARQTGGAAIATPRPRRCAPHAALQHSSKLSSSTHQHAASTTRTHAAAGLGQWPAARALAAVPHTGGRARGLRGVQAARQGGAAQLTAAREAGSH